MPALNTYEKITKILLDLKFQPNISGFDYARYAILLSLEDESLLRNITTQLYPKVAKHFNVPLSIIERSIRTAIMNAYDLNGFLELNNFFNIIIYQNDYKFSNSEFIAIVVQKIKLDLLKNSINLSLNKNQ